MPNMESNYSRSLVFYHFFQKDLTYVANLCHFLEFGYQTDKDYLIIISGKCSLDLPTAANIRYVYAENRNNDYGGYCSALKACDNLNDYDNFFFINSSVRGPYFVHGSSSNDWTTPFTNLLIGNAGLVGSTINILPPSTPESRFYQANFGGVPPYSHVQTTAYAMNKAVLIKLMDSGFFDEDATLSKEAVVAQYELGLSQFALNLGLNLKCLLPEYNQVDYRKAHKEINPTSVNGDVLFRNAYFGRTVHPYECMFIKTNRNLYLESYLDRLAASAYITRKATGSTNPLHSKDLNTYRERLEKVANSTERVNFQGMQFTPEQVIQLTKQLIEQQPKAADLISDLLKAKRP